MSDTVVSNPAIPPPKPPEGPTPVDSLAGKQKEVYDLLMGLLDADPDGTDKGSLAWMFTGIKDAIEDLQESAGGELPGSNLLGGLGGGANGALGGPGGGFPSSQIKAKPTRKPTVDDMMNLPVEFSMGYLLIYNQLLKMAGGEGGESEEAKRKKQGSGIGGFFSNLLQGAEGLALIAVGLLAFAGAMMLFQFIKWEPAMIGLAAFGIFVVGMVLISRIIGSNMKDFETFAQGTLLMTAGIVLFNFAVWVSSKVLPYWPNAWQSLLAYGLFVGMMTGYAKLLGGELGNFIKFSAAVLVLIAGLVLFDFALVVTALALPFIPPALAGLGAFVIFVGLAALLAYALGPLIPAFLTMALAIVLLTGGLLLWGFTLKLFSTLGPQVPPALAALNASMGVVRIVGDFGLSLVVLVPLMILFSAGILVLSLGLMAWAGTLAIFGLISPKIPAAVLGLNQSIGVLTTIAAWATLFGIVSPLIAGFGLSLAVLSGAFLLWGLAVEALGHINPETLAKAKIGMLESIDLLKNLKGVFLQVLTMGAFGIALSVFSGALESFANTILKFGDIGGPVLDRAKIGIRNILDFLTQPGAGGLASLFETMDKNVLVELKKFGQNLKPFSETLGSLATAVSVFGGGNVGEAIKNMSSGVSDTLNAFVKIAAAYSGGGVNHGAIKDFNWDIEHLGAALKALTQGASDTAVTNIPKLTDAFERISRITFGSALEPLFELIKKQSDIDRLAKSFESISNSFKVPQENLFQRIGGALTGGTIGSTEEGNEKAKKKDTGVSMLQVLTHIDSTLTRWDPLLIAIASGTEEIDQSVMDMDALASSNASGTNAQGGTIDYANSWKKYVKSTKE
jgi:hypothetical protein